MLFVPTVFGENTIWNNLTILIWFLILCRCDGFVVACGTGGWLRGTSRCHRRLLGRHYDNVNSQWIQFRHVIDTQALSVWWGFRHWPHWRFSIMNISSAASGASFCVESIFVCIYHWYFTMSNIFIINITLSSEFWIYSISREICARFCCALLCCGYAIVHNEFTWSIYPYSSGLLCWH